MSNITSLAGVVFQDYRIQEERDELRERKERWKVRRTMTTVQGRVFQDQSLNIDDMLFIDCTLVGCTLGYSGRAVSFQRTTLKGCKYVFFGRAKRTVHFLQGTGLMPFEVGEWDDFSNEVH